jgi:dolichol-phosphate mannosyltransferase
MKKKLSIIIPSYNEEKNIQPLILKVIEVLAPSNYDYEFIFVDDGSTDNTLGEIKQQTKLFNNVFYLQLSRNFGKDHALKAGIDHAGGNAIITMDADLQHPPELLPKMLHLWEKGNNIVYTYRVDPNPHVKKRQKITSKLFYKVINLFSDIKLENGASDFRILDERVVNELKKIDEYEIFYRGMVKWVGFSQIGIPYTPAKRHSGTPQYSFIALMKLGISSVMAFSVKPLYIATGVGILFSAASLLYIPYILISLFTGNAVSGWASIIATISFFGGLQLMVLGIIGMYVGKIFLQTKNRPNYIINNKNIELKKENIIGV